MAISFKGAHFLHTTPCYDWRSSSAWDVSMSHGTETCSCVIRHVPSIFRKPTVTLTQVSVCSPVVLVLLTRFKL